MERTNKNCPGPCKREQLPREAFRKDSGRADGLDSYCRKCRGEEAKRNRTRENTRWASHRKKLAAEGRVPSVIPKNVVNARRTAQRHTPPKRCLVKGCTNRGERHHYEGYEREHWNDVIPLCRKHHAAQHNLERARERTGPTYR